MPSISIVLTSARFEAMRKSFIGFPLLSFNSPAVNATLETVNLAGVLSAVAWPSRTVYVPDAELALDKSLSAIVTVPPLLSVINKLPPDKETFSLKPKEIFTWSFILYKPAFVVDVTVFMVGLAISTTSELLLCAQSAELPATSVTVHLILISASSAKPVISFSMGRDAILIVADPADLFASVIV